MIRALRPADVGAAATILRRVRRDGLHTERGLRHLIDSTPERADAAWWVADDDPRGVTGCAVAMRRWWHVENTAFAAVTVLPGADGERTALWDTIEEHVDTLDADKLYTDVIADPAHAAFLRQKGFRPDRVDRVSACDPHAVDLRELAVRASRAGAEGYELVSLAEVRDLRALYELDREVMDDMPGSGAHDISFDEWRRDLVDSPDLSPEASRVVLRDGRPVALALLSIDEEGRRARNEQTGTARRHRERGLATLAKLATIEWAAQNGVHSIITDNAEQNAPMLAINERLGYRPLVERSRWVKDLRAGTNEIGVGTPKRE